MNPGDKTTYDRSVLVWLPVITLIAAVLRLLHLASKSLWMDEGFSIFMARADFATFLRMVRQEELNMVAYYLLLRSWMHLGGSEYFVRLLSALFSIAAIPVAYFLGARLFGRSVGLTAALLLAIHPGHVAYAQEARSYSLEVLLLSMSALYFVKILQRQSVSNWGGYVLASALAIYSHLLAGLVIIAHWFAALLTRKNLFAGRALLYTLPAFVVLILPAAIFTYTQGPKAVSWIRPPNRHDLFAVFQLLTLPKYGLLYAIAWLAAVCAAFKNRQSIAGNWPFTLIVFWLVLPVALLSLISLLKPMLVARFLLMCVPASVLLAAAGLVSLPRRASVAMLFLTALISLAEIRSYYRHHETKEDWRGATRYVLSAAQPGDAVAVLPEYGRFTFDYYQSILEHSAALTPVKIDSPTLSPLQSQRVWILHFGAAEQGAFRTAFGNSYCRQETRQFNLITVWRFEKCHAPP